MTNPGGLNGFRAVDGMDTQNMNYKDVFLIGKLCECWLTNNVSHRTTSKCRNGPYKNCTSNSHKKADHSLYKRKTPKKLHMWNCWRRRIWAWGTDLYLQMGFYMGEPHIVMAETKHGYSFALRCGCSTVQPKTAAFTSDHKRRLYCGEIVRTHGKRSSTSPQKADPRPAGHRQKPWTIFCYSTLHWTANINKM